MFILKLVVTLFFAMQVLQSLDLAFKKLIESLGQANSQLPRADINAGLVLCSLTRRANAFLGGLLAVEYLVDLINVSCGAFFVARYGMAVVGEDGLFRYQMLMMVMNNGLYAILSSARIYMLQVCNIFSALIKWIVFSIIPYATITDQTS